MDFAFTEQQHAFRTSVCAFFESDRVQSQLHVIKQRPEEYDARSIYRLMGEQGLLAANWPTELGGQGRTTLEAAIVAEEMSRYGIPEALQVISIQIVGMLLFLSASEEQKQRYLLPMARGEEFACVLYTEPRSGSDLGSLETRAERQEDGTYAIYGRKVYSMKTHLTDYGLCAARTSHKGSKYEGLTLFMVPLHQEGVSLQPIASMADESFYEVVLDGACVGADAMIGELNGAWSLINKALAVERTGLDYYVRAQRWFDMIWDQAMNSGQVEDDTTLIELARLSSKLDASRLMTYRVLEQLQRGAVEEVVAATSKWYASELACEVVFTGTELRGLEACMADGHGYSDLYGSLESAYRETPGLTISAGSSEMMLETIAKMGLAGDR